MKTILLAVALFVSSLTIAGEGEHVDLFGRSYTNSCGYYSNTSGDYRIQFLSIKARWGTKVSLIYGWKGYNALSEGNSENFDWSATGAIEMKSTARYTWEANLNEVNLHSRGSNHYLTGIQFVLKIETEGEPERYIKGSSSAMGYLQAPILLYGSPCVDPSHSLPEFKQVPYFSVEKWR